MAIELNLDLSYLARYYDISPAKLLTYGKKSITEIMKAEAAEGNKKAQEFVLKVLKDPNEILKLFKLNNAVNKYEILSNMSQSDLTAIMPLLEKQDMVNGLGFFTQEGLINFIRQMPKKEITKVLFEKMSPRNFIKTVQDKELNKFFNSEKVDKGKVKELVKSLDRDSLSKMVESVTGKSCQDTSKADLLKQIEKMNDKNFVDSLKVLKPKHKMAMILSLTEEDPKLWEEFSVETLTRPLEKMEKTDIIQGMSVLEEDSLLKVLDNLPQDLMAVVTTQIDPKVFADILVTQYQNIIQRIALGN